MAISIRRLGPGDEALLAAMAEDEADFDLDGRGTALAPLDATRARRYLANPGVLHWIAAEGDLVVGDLYCLVVPLSDGRDQELLLYDIGVRADWRRRGVGRALLDTMEAWMRDNGVDEVWVLADNPGAVEFYRAGGFAVADDQPVYLTRSLSDG